MDYGDYLYGMVLVHRALIWLGSSHWTDEHVSGGHDEKQCMMKLNYGVLQRDPSE